MCDQRRQCLRRVVGCRRQGVDGTQRADSHFAGCQSRDQCNADLPVEANRLKHHRECAAQGACQAVLDGGPGGAFRCARKAGQKPQGNGQHQDHAAYPFHEDGHTLPQTYAHVAYVRQVVVGQLHHQGASLAAGCEALEDPGHKQRAQDAGDVKGKQHQPLQVQQAPDFTAWDEGAYEQRVDRQPGGAGHERRDHDGHQPVARIGNGAGRHDAGNGAGKTRQQGDKRAPRQANAAHQAVQQKCCARQVAGLFQHQDKKEQDDDLRQEHHDTACAGDDAVHDQASDPAHDAGVRQQRAHHGAQPVAGGLDRIHGRDRPAEDRLENQEQHRGQQDGPEYRMQHNAVNAVAHGVRDQLIQRQPFQDAAYCVMVGIGCMAWGRIRVCCCRSRALPQARVVEQGAQFGVAAAPGADGADHGHTQLTRKRCSVYRQAPCLCQVLHVHCHYTGQAQAFDGQYQAQAAP